MPARLVPKAASCLLLAMSLAAVRPSAGQTPAPCRRLTLETELNAGQTFERPIGGGLRLMLEALPSGWLLRILPATGPRGQHDYAELATPPYRSVNPLLLTTDFSFRAQDAVAWNPRHFRFAATPAEFRSLSAAYARYLQSDPPRPRDEAELAALTSRMHPAELQILDARLIPGTADQAATAAMVASHFSQTPHSIAQPGAAGASPLGQLLWLRIRVTLNLPPGFTLAAGLPSRPHPCNP